ncbi:MAG: pyruvate ferredoxin oxidoreductase, partial [Patescibacteria group bacterium]
SAGTTRQAIDELRQKGLKVGLIKIRLFRPFPYEAIAKVLKNIKIIGVLDRAESLGAHPPLGAEIKNSLYGRKLMPIIKNYIYGLGGRDLTVEQIKDVYKNLLKQKQQENSIEYIGLNE